jgi:uncharacterized protein YndB with AHSA1/START domain
MRQFVSELEIAAPTNRVWELTVDVERWPAISPATMTSVTRMESGAFGVGSRARIKQPGQRARVWTVSEFRPDQCFAWSTSSRGLAITARHELVDSAGGTRNILVVEMSGALAGLMGALAGRTIRRAIAAENAGFKAAAEA